MLFEPAVALCVEFIKESGLESPYNLCGKSFITSSEIKKDAFQMIWKSVVCTIFNNAVVLNMDGYDLDLKSFDCF